MTGMCRRDIKVFDSDPYCCSLGQSNNTSSNSMGKCVSKQTSAISIASADLTTTSSNNDFRRCSASSDYVPIRTDYGHSTNNEDDCGLNNEGQSESKKKEKRQGPETKGTAMSFGFRKKLQTPKKSKNPQFKEKEKQTTTTTTTPTSISSSPEAVDQEKYQSATVISNPGLVTNEDLLNSDKNGNAGPESTSDRRPTPQIVPSKRDTGITNNTQQQQHRANRFGFRSTNIVRPASAGITPKLTDFQENVENNNFTDKRRSKSASATHTRVSAAFNRLNDQQSINENKSAVPKINAVSVNNSENLRHQQQEKKVTWEAPIRFKGTENTNRQYHVINTGMHTNVIVKPTPQPAVSVSRFTLHTASLPKPQYPVPISLTTRTTMDCKNAKQVANNNRKGFFGPREVSADSGISSLDNTFDNGGGSPRRSRNRPRNLEMVISGRHKFEVRDLDDTLSCDSVEPLLLPKLPSAFSSDIQTVPLCGLVRTNTVLSRDDLPNNNQESNAQRKVNRNHSDAESVEEEKLFRDRSTSEKETKNPSLKDYTTSSKNSSPGSSRASWCNAGESLAVKDCSSLSLSSSDESKDVHIEKTVNIPEEQEISSFTLSEKPSLLSSLTETVPKCIESEIKINERPATLSHIAESKFAEMAAAVSDVLLDDETSPTDSLVSSTESDDVLLKKAKKKANEETQEKDIDEISPELELSSPLSPGTPTHASNSLSLSDVGRDFLIDDEIADQPALLFSDKADGPESVMMHHSLTDTPTLIETGSNKSAALNSSSKAKSKAHAAIEHILRTPLSLRKATLLNRAESLDTLSPCESIASDDLMMDFESHSSMDSIDRMSVSMRSRCESAFQALDDAQLLSELESKGTEMIREWNNILRVHRTGRESIISQLPARATRLLNRSRLQQSQLSNAGSDSPKSGDSLPRRSSRASSLHLSSRDANSSSDDLFLHDKSFRNSMIQDVLYFKKQLIRLRRVLQEDEESLTRTDTLNPFDFGNGQFFGSCGIDSSNNSDDKDLGSLTSATNEDSLQELADLRRQVVYLQGQVEDRDRTIRLQKNVIDKLEIENQKIQTVSVATSISEKECVNSATQTERVRPLSIGQEGLARSKPECTSYAAYLPATASTTISPTTTTTNQTSRRHTIISTTFTNLNHVSQSPRRASIGWEKLTYKPVKTTLIGEPINNSNIINNNNNNNNNNNSNSNNNNEIVNKSNSHFERSTTKQQVNGISRSNINSTSNNSINKQNTAKKIVQQQQQHQQSQKFIEINKCHLDKKSKFEDLKTEHHSPSVTIV